MLNPPCRLALSLATVALLPLPSIMEGANQPPEEALIAVAANFAHVAEVLADSFNASSPPW